MFVVQPNGSRLSCGGDPPSAPRSFESSTEFAGAQTQFLPEPGAVSFKRLLGGCISGDSPR